jgi:DNA invertase Pin-like site-specific DNA recombinase
MRTALSPNGVNAVTDWGDHMAQGKFVAYYRVSTAKQGRSGLGLEAQQEAVRAYLNGGSWQLVAEVVEVESGKRNDRSKLAEALRLCRLHGATLIIAKLDRLARNVAFISNLMESGVEFTAVDFPQANRLTVHILAAVAEHEAKAISTRTKDALAAAKARGVRLGGDRGNLPAVDLPLTRKRTPRPGKPVQVDQVSEGREPNWPKFGQFPHCNIGIP